MQLKGLRILDTGEVQKLQTMCRYGRIYIFKIINSYVAVLYLQVFMLRGISRKWQQPVYYNSVSGATSAEDIMKIIKLIVRKCKESGLEVFATVCDQGTNNVRAIKGLLADTAAWRLKENIDCQEPTFNIDGTEVIPIFDIPHVFKCIRNNLLKYNLHFEKNGEKKVNNFAQDLYRNVFRQYYCCRLQNGIIFMQRTNWIHM